ncbi:hypothetical protein ACWCO0_14905 [Streptomyces tubercidicus]|uniref:hypothetical protein n=1 Tax=Streptomyces tubercidicus TaxID=47759 RepID=UPI0022B77682|nr:hypothetical protein [Streptomyces tubercidicus]WAU10108.1 hypothetical protein STRTU_000163 [Streptomyces tubercidicus]
MKKSAIAGGCVLGLFVIACAYKGSATTTDPLSLAEYRKIEAGSSEKTLFAYTNTCQQNSESERADDYPTTWTCYGAEGGSSAVFFYSEGVMFSKSQTGLA